MALAVSSPVKTICRSLQKKSKKIDCFYWGAFLYLRSNTYMCIHKYIYQYIIRDETSEL